MKYKVTDPSGRSLVIDGDHEPTADDLTAIFEQSFPALQDSAVPAQAPMDTTQYGPDVEAMRHMASELSNLTPEQKADLDRPLVNIPELPPIISQSLDPLTRMSVENVRAMASTLATPRGIAMAPAMIGAPELVGALYGLQALPQIPEELKAAKKSLSEGQLGEAGRHGLGAAQSATIAALGALGVAEPAIPPTARAASLFRESGRVGEPNLPEADLMAQALSMPIRHPSIPFIEPQAPVAPQTQAGGLFTPTGLTGARAVQAQTPRLPRPTIPESPPEPERGMTVLQEIRQAGARTKEAVRDLFPRAQLSREEAANLRDLAWQTKELLPGDVERVFGLSRLNQIMNSGIQPGAPGVTGRPSGGSIREMTPRPEMERGAPTLEDIRAQKAVEDQWLRPFTVEWTRLKNEHPTWSNDKLWETITEAVRTGTISMPLLESHTRGGGGVSGSTYGPIMNLNRPRSREGVMWSRRMLEAASRAYGPPPPAVEARLLREDEGSPPESIEPPPTTQAMTPRGPMGTEGGTGLPPSVEDVRAQREFDERRRRIAAEFQELKRISPNATDEEIWNTLLRNAPHLMPAIGARTPGEFNRIPEGMRAIMDFDRLHTHAGDRPLTQEEWDRPNRIPPEPPTTQQYPGFLRAGARGEEVPLPYDPRNQLTPEERLAYASRQQQTAEVHGNVRTPPESRVPESQGRGGVLAQTEGGLQKEKAQEQSQLRVGQTNYGTAVVDDKGQVHFGYSEHSSYPKGVRGFVVAKDPNYEYKAHDTMALSNLDKHGLAFVTQDELQKLGSFAEVQRRLQAGEELFPVEQIQPAPVENVVAEENGWRITQEANRYWLVNASGERTMMADTLDEAKDYASVYPLQEYNLSQPLADLRGTRNRPAPVAPEPVTQTGSPAEAGASLAKPPTPSGAGGPPATQTGSLIPPESPERQPEGQVGQHPTSEPGPGMVDLGASLRVTIPNAPSRFAHWWDQNFGKPFRKILPTVEQFLSGYNVRATMAEFRDSVENRGKRFARYTTNEIQVPLDRWTRQMQRARNLPYRSFARNQELVEDALSAVIESGGDTAELDRMRYTLLGSTVAPRYWQQREIDAIDFAIYHLNQLRPWAQEYAGYTDAQVALENANGIPTLKRDKYVPHRQEIDELTFLTAGGQGSSTFFEKPRTYNTYADSIAAGVEPKTLSATTLLENRLSLGSRLVGNRQWLSSLRSITDTTSGQPIAVNMRVVRRADGSTVTVPPAGYVGESIGLHQIAIHKGYEDVFKALTEPSWMHKDATRRSFLTANATGKSVNLMFDSFHLGRVAFWDSLIKSAGITTFKLPFPSYGKGVTLLDFSERQIRDMAAHGEIPQRWMNDLVENKRRLDLAVATGYNMGRISDGLYNEVIHSLPIVGPFNKWLFEKFQRGAMSESWLLEFQRYRKGLPHLSEIDVARRVSHDLNARFGNLGRQGVFRSKTAQDLARMIFLAPQWNEGLIRSELGALRDFPRMLKDATRSRRLFAGVLMRSVGGMALMQFVANQVINQITRGKFTWENPEEGFGAKISAWVPDLVENGPGFFLHPLGLAAETTHLLTNMYSRRGGDIAQVLLDYGRSRSSVVMRPILTAATRTDFLGRSMQPGTLWHEILKSSIALPIAAQAAGSFAKQIATGQPSEAFQGQYQKQVMSSAGIRTERAPSPEQRMLALAQTWRRDHGVPRNVQVIGEGEFQRLTQAIRIGNQIDARNSLKVLRKDKTDRQIIQHFERWAKAPFTGTVTREREFRDGLSSEQQVAYQRARDQRRRIVDEVRLALSR